MFTPGDTFLHEKKVTRRIGKNRDTTVHEKKLTRPYRKKLNTAVQEKSDTAVTQLYSCTVNKSESQKRVKTTKITTNQPQS